MHNNHPVIIWQHQGFERKIARKAKVKVDSSLQNAHLLTNTSQEIYRRQSSRHRESRGANKTKGRIGILMFINHLHSNELHQLN